MDAPLAEHCPPTLAPVPHTQSCGTFAPWSLRPHGNEDSVWSSIHRPESRPEEVSCIVCYDTIEQKAEWHHCRTCSATWCDACMEAMFNTARDEDGNDGASLACPQCRTQVGEMQFLSRIARYMDQLGCLETAARDLIWYENLLCELVHLAQSEPDGQPFFLLPPAQVSRIMARDEICGVVDQTQGKGAGARLRRMLRANAYGDCTELILEGYVAALKAAGAASVLPFLSVTLDDLKQMAEHHRALERDGAEVNPCIGTDLLPKAARILERELMAEAARHGCSKAPIGRPCGSSSSRAGGSGSSNANGNGSSDRPPSNDRSRGKRKR